MGMNEVRRLEQITVVVIDDDSSTREALRMMLEAAGARVMTARDAEEGVEAVLSHAPDAVVCDLDLPAMDGFYLIQRLRDDEIRRNRPMAVAVAITGHTDESYRLRSIGEGFQHFMTKPAQPDRLIALLSNAVGERAAG
jgi:two-component system, cell cycle response regulator CtrA